MNIYVGNLSRETTEEELIQEFGAFGRVESARIVKDRLGGQSRGFAYVEMPSQDEGCAAIAALKGKTLRNRGLDVNEAEPRPTGRRNWPRDGRTGRGPREIPGKR